jgi:hypothetical protein
VLQIESLLKMSFIMLSGRLLTRSYLVASLWTCVCSGDEGAREVPTSSYTLLIHFHRAPELLYLLKKGDTRWRGVCLCTISCVFVCSCASLAFVGRPYSLLSHMFIFISHKRSWIWTKYLLQGCVSSYHVHVWFFGEFRWLFCRGFHGFSRRLWFAPDMSPNI